MTHKKSVKKISAKHIKKSTHKKAEILLSTEINGTSVAHGHTAYQQGRSFELNKETDDKNKNLIMYIGVGVVMTIIVIVWIINLKSTLGPNAFSIQPTESKSSANFDDLKNNLNQTLSDVKNQIKTLEEKAKENSAPTSTTTFIPTSTIAPTMSVTPTSTVMPSPTPTFKSITPTDNKSKTLNTLPK